MLGRVKFYHQKEGRKGRREDEGDAAEKGGEELPMAGVLETWEMTVKKNHTKTKCF